MNRLAATILAVFLVAAAGAARAEAPADDAALRVHLPREVKVSSNTLTLGRLAICRGDDEQFVAKAEGVAMGRAPWSGEELVVKRATVLSRLGSSGVDTDRVRITGADAVTVRRDERVIPAEKLLEAARVLLEEKHPGPDGCLWRLVRRPEDLPVRAAEDVKLTASLLEESPRNHVRVAVSVVSGERTLGRTELTYRVMYPRQEARAKADLPAGTVLTSENVEVRTTTSHRPQRSDWSAPHGMITIRPVAKGAVLRDSMLRTAKPEIVVHRNETVVMKIDGVGFTLRWLGEALDDGRPGDVIKVRNVDSRRVVSARVAYDGTVKPVYEGMEE